MALVSTPALPRVWEFRVKNVNSRVKIRDPVLV